MANRAWINGTFIGMMRQVMQGARAMVKKGTGRALSGL